MKICTILATSAAELLIAKIHSVAPFSPLNFDLQLQK